MDLRSKLVVAFVVGVGSFFLMFLLGEGVRIPASVPGAELIHTISFIGGVGGYFLVSGYFLSRGNPEAVPRDWPIVLALNVVPLAMAIIVWFVEPDRAAGLQMTATAGWGVVCSWVGAAMAGRAARRG